MIDRHSRLALGIGWVCAGCDTGVLPPAPAWDPLTSVAPFFSNLDLDQSGGVEVNEWAPRAYPGGDFERIDTDRDGQISPEEWLANLRSTDPLTFDGRHVRRVPTPDDPDPVYGGSWEVRVTDEVVRFLLAELALSCPSWTAPPTEAVRVASAAGSLESAESLQLQHQLIAGYQSCGLELPVLLVAASQREAPSPEDALGSEAPPEGAISPGPAGSAGSQDAPGVGSGPD